MDNKRIALFPGSFDPITLGHTSIVNRALPLFDGIIIGIGANAQKKSMFTLKQRKSWILDTFAHEKKIAVERYTGLTVDFCKQKNISFIIRGIRNQQDFEYERSIAQMNRQLMPNVETIFLFTELAYAAINSSIVRDIIKNGGNAEKFIPKAVRI